MSLWLRPSLSLTKNTFQIRACAWGPNTIILSLPKHPSKETIVLSQFNVIPLDYSPFRIKIHGKSYSANGTFLTRV